MSELYIIDKYQIRQNMANQIGLLIAIFCLGFLLLNIWIFEPIIVGFEGEHLELEDIEFYDRYHFILSF